MSKCLVTNVEMHSQWSLLTVWSPSCHTMTILSSRMICTMPTCYYESAGKVLQINCSASVFFVFWHLAIIPSDVAKVLFPWGPCHHLLLVTELPLPPPTLQLHGWKPGFTSFISDFHSFFFLSLCSTPLLSFSLCCVLISPTPLLCHQLGPLVSKSWSHCACVAIFSVFWSHTRMHGVLWHSTNAFIELILDMHIYIVAINSWLPLAGFWRNSGFITSLLSKWGSRCSFGWYAQNQEFEVMRMLIRLSFILMFWQQNEWHSQEIVTKWWKS